MQGDDTLNPMARCNKKKQARQSTLGSARSTLGHSLAQMVYGLSRELHGTGALCPVIP